MVLWKSERRGGGRIKRAISFCKINLHTSVPCTASKQFYKISEPALFTFKVTSYLNLFHTKNTVLLNNTSRAEPAYNDIGLYVTLVYSVRYSVTQINSSLLNITLYFSVITTLFYNDMKY
jgi:hypothetical protein